MSVPFRIVFVCTGNSCRSPLAEYVLRKHLADRNLDANVEVISAGISAEEGDAASDLTRKTASKLGVDLSGFKARSLTREICESAHAIIVMDYPHREHIDEHYPEHSSKVRMLGGFVSDDPGRLAVSDPMGATEEFYLRIAGIINHACQTMVSRWDELKKRFYEDGKLFIAVGADHRGFANKQVVKQALEEKGFVVVDCGTDSTEPCDHPDFAFQVGELVALGRVDRGILVCASGHGMVIAANKVPTVRAVLPMDVEHAKLSRSHNNANVLVLGSKFVDGGNWLEMAEAWLGEPFLGDRYQRRINKISRYEHFLRC